MTSVTAIGLVTGRTEYTFRPGVQRVTLPQGYLLKINGAGEAEVMLKEQPVWGPGELPPVGTVCEVNLGGPDWVEVQIIAHFRNSAAMVAAFIPTADGEKRVAQAIAGCFRPIRTAEQIAAEERNCGIDALCEFIRGTAVGNDFHRPFWERAYDRGLRAPE